ncbi:hypothetical protein [Thalassospira xiamenensis]|jgi:hypothetical protein|uniref:hypothetical protein n=1 Tax=Thalassospira xiamenensis TaxID=220697 RepID=UPI001FFED1E5|nr:hypothetical protein [Thalassospira xiamenensis]MCK2167387.1 hypothetical protein [Thalassospira xiamenensis]
MASPSAHHYPADRTAVLSVSLPLHPDPLFDPAPNAKTREAQGLAGFCPGAFLPLTLSLCHKQKNKSRTFLKNFICRLKGGGNRGQQHLFTLDKFAIRRRDSTIPHTFYDQTNVSLRFRFQMKTTVRARYQPQL